MMRSQNLRYAAFVIGIVLFIACASLLGETLRRPIRASSDKVRFWLYLLPVVPGLLMGWGLRQPANTPRRFRPVEFLVFCALPLLMGVLPILLFNLAHLPVRFLFSDLEIASAMPFLSPISAMLAGIGFSFAFRSAPPDAPAADESASEVR